MCDETCISAFGPGEATEHEYACLSEFKYKMGLEYRPDDPPIPLEEHIQGWKNIPSFVEYEAYIISDPSKTKIVASSEIEIQNTDDNENAVFFTIEVLPKFRHQGNGRQSLNTLLPFAQNINVCFGSPSLRIQFQPRRVSWND